MDSAWVIRMKLIEQRRQGALFFAYICTLNIGDDQPNGLKRLVPRAYGLNKMVISHDEIRWFFDEDDLIAAGYVLADQLWKNPHEANLLFNLFDKTALLNQRFADSLADKRLKGIPTSELVKMVNDYFVLYTPLFDIGTFAELLDFSFQKLIVTELKNQKIPGKEHPVIISTRSQPSEESFSREAEKNVLKIAARVREKQFSFPSAFRDPEIVGLMNEHIAKFYWSSCNYFSFSGLGLKNLRVLVKAACESKKSPRELLDQIDSEHQKLLQQKQELSQRFRLNKKTLFYFDLAQQVALLYDKRKKSQMHGFYSVGRILKELARRANVPFDLAKYVLPYETEAFASGKIPVSELQKRRDYLFVDYNQYPPRLVMGDLARKAEDDLWNKSTLSKNDLNGSCACPGTVRGVARVIKSKKQLHELQPNEILVTSMTDPDFVPYLKNAIGIITDDGGITSHSAIISRELKIPCIVGTKLATRTIKTGDMLDLRAHHGLVRVIQKAEKTV